MRLGRILDYRNSTARAEREDWIHVGGLAEEVDDNDRPGARRKHPGDRLGADAPRRFIHIGEYRPSARVNHRAGAGDESKSGDLHLVAGTDAEGSESKMERGGAVARAVGLARLAKL